MQVRLNYREPGITEREPAAPDNLTEREPKSAIIARRSADDCEPLHLTVGIQVVTRERLVRGIEMRRTAGTQVSPYKGAVQPQGGVRHLSF